MRASRSSILLVVLILLAVVALYMIAFEHQGGVSRRESSTRSPETALRPAAPGALPKKAEEHVAVPERRLQADETKAQRLADSAPSDGRLDVTIVVREPGGSPLEGIRIIAEVLNPDEERVLRHSERVGFTDQGGRLTLRLYDGPFRISANHRKGRPDLSTVVKDVDLAPPQPEVVLELDLLTGEIDVLCVDDRGQPIGGATVNVAPLRVSGRTGLDGTVRFTGLSRGLRVVCTHESWQTLELEPGEREFVRLVCARTGRLTVRSDPPLPSLEAGSVDVLPADGSPGELREVTLDPAQQKKIELRPGAYRLEARLPAGSNFAQVRPIEVVVYPDTDTPATVPLTRVTGVLSGSVLRPDGQPAAGARLKVRSRGGPCMKLAQADEYGRFEIRGLPEAPLALWAGLNQVPDHRQDPLLELDRPVRDMWVTFSEPRTVELVVTLGEPLPEGHSLFLCSDWSEHYGEWTTWKSVRGSGLEVVLPRVAPGSYWLVKAPYIYPGLKTGRFVKVDSSTPEVLRIDLTP
ncbi:MAG: carboxypeptidase-like regulatory domain-containing protein [Planctomycetota bacterium]